MDERDELPTVPPTQGDVPEPRHERGPEFEYTRPLDMSQDPDRYDPARDEAPVGPLDMSQDPDRYRPPGQGQTLPELLGEGSYEEPRDGIQWLLGLIGVVLFLALVTWFFSSYATP